MKTNTIYCSNCGHKIKMNTKIEAVSIKSCAKCDKKESTKASEDLDFFTE